MRRVVGSLPEVMVLRVCANGSDTASGHIPVVDTVVVQLLRNIRAPAIDVCQTPVSQARRLGSQDRFHCFAAQIQRKGVRSFHLRARTNGVEHGNSFHVRCRSYRK